MDFEEYFRKNFNDGLSEPSKYILRFTFEAGQQSKQAEIDALKAKIDDAFLENAKLKHVIDQVKLHNGSLGFRSMQRMIEELLK